MSETALDTVERFGSADNFRDVAGPAYVATDGVALRPGRVFRANALVLTEADAAAVAALGVRDVYDLRTHPEVAAVPDAEIPGAAWHHVEIRGIPMFALADLTTREEADSVMRAVYRSFVELADARASFADLLRHVADAEAPLVFHCAAGKDRTGWAAALLQHVAGLDAETILADYLLTNERTAESRAAYLRAAGDRAEVFEVAMVVTEGYLEEGYAAARAAYGSLDGYLRDGLGLSDAELDRLRGRLRA